MSWMIRGGAAWLLLFLVLARPTGPARGGDETASPAVSAPAVTRLELAEDGTSLLVSATLDAPLEGLNRQALEGGIPFSFTFRFRLTKKGGLLGEKSVRTGVVTHTLQFDPLRKVYRFIDEGSEGKVERETSDRLEALAWMGQVVRWPLFPVAGLEPGRYRVRAMATVRSAELPSVFGILFFFTTLFNQDTPWKETDFEWR